METRICEFRKKLKMTQEDLANKVEVTRQTVNALESGKYNPSLELAFKISKVLKAKKIEDVFILKK